MAYFWSFLVAFIIMAVFQIVRMKKNKSTALNGLQLMKKQLMKFNPTEEFISADNKYILLLDEKAKKINFTTAQSNKTYDIKDILGTQIINSVSTESDTTTRENLFGSLSSSTTTATKVSKIELKIAVNDTECPYYNIAFFDSLVSLGFGHPFVEKAKTNIEHWEAVLNILMKREFENTGQDGSKLPPELKKILEETTQVTLSQLHTQDSVADELIKISNLLQQGMITQEEYDSLKAKIIS